MKQVTRRQFLGSAVGAISLVTSGCVTGREPSRKRAMTVLGPVDIADLGPTLPHEHALVDFIGADKVSRARYNQDEAFAVALPHFQRVRALGCKTVADCTPAYIGRDPVLLRRLAEATGLHILTNTGYYGAAGSKYLPQHTYIESAEELSQRWIREWQAGIEGTGIRPGFMKIGVDGGKLSAVHRKLVRAAALAHKETGLTIAAHTGNGIAAMDEIEVLASEGVGGRAFIWVHANGEGNKELHLQAGRAGAWVEFDGVGPDSIGRHVELVLHMKANGLLGHVLLSHDAGWYNVGQEGGGKFRPFDTLFTTLIPALHTAGLTETEVHQLTVLNPARAFTIERR